MTNFNSQNEIAIIGGLRIPFAKSFGHYGRAKIQEMLTLITNELVTKFNLEKKTLGEVAFGSVMDHTAAWNLSREVVLGTKLSAHTPALNLQRACGTSLDTFNVIGLKIACGQIQIGIAGGADTNSDLPVAVDRRFGNRLVEMGRARSLGERFAAFKGFSLQELKLKFPGVVEPRTVLSMGEHCEQMVKKWEISREAQDQLALESHQKAAHAYERGFYDDLLIPYRGLSRDTTMRGNTTLEQLARLKPAFDRSALGTLTAGNSTPLTDGASAVLMASVENAKREGYPILAKLIDFQSSGVDYVSGEEGLLMAPTYAVSELLRRNGMHLQDFDLYEIHEAFAGQVLCTLKAWESETYCKDKLQLEKAIGEIDRSKMNVNGGSLAIGHPFAATGTRIVSSLAKALKERGGGRGLISICTAGGMGVAAILESEG